MLNEYDSDYENKWDKESVASIKVNSEWVDLWSSKIIYIGIQKIWQPVLLTLRFTVYIILVIIWDYLIKYLKPTGLSKLVFTKIQGCNLSPNKILPSPQNLHQLESRKECIFVTVINVWANRSSDMWVNVKHYNIICILRNRTCMGQAESWKLETEEVRPLHLIVTAILRFTARLQAIILIVV